MSAYFTVGKQNAHCVQCRTGIYVVLGLFAPPIYGIEVSSLGKLQCGRCGVAHLTGKPNFVQIHHMVQLANISSRATPFEGHTPNLLGVELVEEEYDD